MEIFTAYKAAGIRVIARIDFSGVEPTVIRTHFAVAENGAVWLTEELMGQRNIPYIF